MKELKKTKDNQKKTEMKKEAAAAEKEKLDSAILSDEKLKKVTGGGFGDDIPRVPENPIDDDAKKKFE